MEYTEEQLAQMTAEERAALDEEFDEGVSQADLDGDDAGAGDGDGDEGEKQKPSTVKQEQVEQREAKFKAKQDQANGVDPGEAVKGAKVKLKTADPEQDDDKGEDNTGGEGDDGQDQGDTGGDDGAAGDKGKEGEGENEGQTRDSETLEGDRPAPPQQFLPVDYPDKLKAIDEKKKDLHDKWAAGDIEQVEYSTGLDEVSKEERRLERMRDKAEDFAADRQTAWLSAEVPRWMKDHPEYTKSEALFELMDKRIVAAQNLAIKNRMDHLNPALLDREHRRLVKEMPGMFSAEEVARMGVKGKAVATGKEKQADGKRTTLKIPKPDAPKTLAKTPATDVDDPTQGEFAQLDRLQRTDPLRYQKELGRMMREDRSTYDAYMAQ